MAGVTLTEALPGTGPISASGFRPWWETIRYYCLNAILAIDLMIYYVTYNFSTADCIPYSNEMSTLSAPNTKFVNSFCFCQVDKVYRFAGRNILVGFIFLHLAYSWWEIIPKVRDRFVTVKKVDKLLSDKHFLKGEVKDLTKSPHKNQEKMILLKDIFEHLFLLKIPGCPLFCLYHLRNLIAIVFVALAIFAMASFLKFPIKLDEDAEAIFNCSVSNETARTVGFKKFSCSNNLESQLQMYFLAILCILILTEVITLTALIASIIVMYSKKVSVKCSKDRRILSKDYAFVLFFTRHSLGVHNSTEQMLSLLENFAEGEEERDFEKLFPHLETISQDQPSHSTNIAMSGNAQLVYTNTNTRGELAENPEEFAKKPLKKRARAKNNQIDRKSATTTTTDDIEPFLSSLGENLMEMQTLNRSKEKFSTRSSPKASFFPKNSIADDTSVPVSESEEE